MQEPREYTSKDQSTGSSHLLERRRYIRVTLNSSEWVSTDGTKWHPCTIMDLSAGGAQILTTEIDPWAVSSVILKFHLIKKYELEASIVWHNAAAQHCQRIGLRWTSLSSGAAKSFESDILNALNRLEQSWEDGQKKGR